MEIKEYPTEVLELIVKRTKEINGRLPNMQESLTSCFNWSRSIEGLIFWDNIYRGNFETFYKKYPKKEIDIKYISNTEYIVNKGNEKYKIIIQKIE